MSGRARPTKLLLAAAAGIAALTLAPGEATAQAKELEFSGQVRCRNPNDQWVGLPRALIVPAPDASQAQVTTAPSGAFSFVLPRELVETGESPRFWVFLGPPAHGDSVGAITRVDPSPIRQAWGKRFADRRPVGLEDIQIDESCETLEARHRLRDIGTWSVDALVQGWTERPNLDFEGASVVVEEVTTAGAGSGGTVWRAVKNFAARLFGRFAPPPTSGDCLACPALDSARTLTDTLRVVDRGYRPLSVPFGLLTQNAGFAFAPGPDLGSAALWNPSALALGSQVQLSFQSDDAGFTQGGVSVPLGGRVVLGGVFYRFRQDDLRLCELIEPVPGPGGTYFHPAGSELGSTGEVPRDVCSGTDPSLGMVDGFLVPGFESDAEGLEADDANIYFGSVIGSDPGPFKLEQLGSNLGFEEQIVGLSAGFALGSGIGVGLTAKQTRRQVEAPRLARDVLTSFFEDGSTITNSFFQLLNDVETQENLDFDVGALWLLSDVRIGASLMNVLGTRVPLRDGRRMSSRTLGVGVGYGISGLDLGADVRFFSIGRPELAFGTSYRVLDRFRLRAGYSTEFSSWSGGVTYRGASYTYSDAGPLGSRHLLGFGFVF